MGNILASLCRSCLERCFGLERPHYSLGSDLLHKPIETLKGKPNIFLTGIFFRCTFVLNGPVAKEIMKKFSLAGWPRSSSQLVGEHALSVTNGPTHKRHHARLCRTIGTVTKQCLPIIDRATHDCFSSWQGHGDSISVDDIDRAMKLYIMKTSVTLLRGRDGPQDDEYYHGLQRTFTDWINGFAGAPINIWFLPFGKAMAARKKLLAEAAGLIQEVKEGKHAGFLLANMASEIDGEQMTEEELQDLVIQILFGSYDTVLALLRNLVCAWSDLMTDQRAAIVEEIDEVWDGRQPLEWEAKEKCFHHGQCGIFIKEVLRVKPSLPFVFRKVDKEVTIDGVTLPKGSPVFVSIIDRHSHLSEQFGRAISLDNDPDSYGSDYMPWGVGNRVCPGQKYAEMAAMVWLMHLSRYEIKVHERIETVFPWNAWLPQRLTVSPRV